MLSIVRFIGFLSHKQIYDKWIIKNEKRTAFIFQNKNDMNFIKELIYIPNSKSILIYGSGVPKDYIKKDKKK